MLEILFRKVLSNRWLYLALLGGLLLATALISGIPIFTDGVFQRFLVEELESYQIREDRFPGTFLVQKSFRRMDRLDGDAESHLVYDGWIREELYPRLALPFLVSNHRLTLSEYFLEPLEEGRGVPEERRARIEMVEGLEEHIAIRHGRGFSELPSDGEVEAIVTERAMQVLDLRLNETYRAYNPLLEKDYTFTLVGVFVPLDRQDGFWYRSLASSGESLFISHSYSLPDIDDAFGYTEMVAEWFYAIDYYAIDFRSLGTLLNSINRQVREISRRQAVYEIPMKKILEQYLVDQRKLRVTLNFLELPVLILLGFFLVLVSTLILENDRGEIAVLKSRGMGTGQIFRLYLYIALLLGILSFLLGPVLGMVVCRLLGTASGFMEFSSWTGLPVAITVKAYVHSLAGAFLFMAAIVLPALYASRATVVAHKRERSRSMQSPFWKKYFLDLLLIVLAGYGFYRFQVQEKIVSMTGIMGAELPIDPLFFITSVLFIFGCGLLCLRFFPFLVDLLHLSGRDHWPPGFYISVLQIGRSRGYETYVLIFLLLTMGIGVFNSSTARSMNRHIRDTVLYKNGADLSAMPFWLFKHDYEDVRRTMEELHGLPGENDPLPDSEAVYDTFRDTEGVSGTTMVLRKEGISVRTDFGRTSTADLMGINPQEFGGVAWTREDLMPAGFEEYLSYMAVTPNGLIISQSIAEQLDIGPGATLFLVWDDGQETEGVVFAVIRYWPTYNPHMGDGDLRHFVVASLPYMELQTAGEPLEIWANRSIGVSEEVLYEDIRKRGFRFVSFLDSRAEIGMRRQRPDVQGTNGVLTLNFLATLFISLAGLAICWMLSVKARSLQFGVIRAMGLSRRRVTMIVLWEQLMISGAAILLGSLIGGIAGQLYIPMFQLASGAGERVPPPLVGAYWRDYGALLVFLGVLLFLVMLLVGLYIRRLRVAQVLKLGEE